MSSDRPPPPLPPRKSLGGTSPSRPVETISAHSTASALLGSPLAQPVTSASTSPSQRSDVVAGGATAESEASRPPIPARRTTEVVLSPEPIPSSSPSAPSHHVQSPPSGEVSTPPPLPRRKTPAPPPPPVSIPADINNVQTAVHEQEEDSTTPLATSRPPDTGVTVAITPATPPDSDFGTEPNSPSFGQSADQFRGTPQPDQAPAPVPIDGHIDPASAPEPGTATNETIGATTSGPFQPASTPSPAQPTPLAQQPPPLPARRSKASTAATATIPSLAWIAYTAFLVILAYFHVSLTGLALAALGGWLAVKRIEKSAENALNEQQARERESHLGTEEREGSEAVDWVNHALYALFPLISTDVLTPFVDLMEDALMGQVPPIVTSVRLTSPALGSRPLLLTSLRPMSDQEWFSSLATTDKRSVAMMDASASHGSKSKWSNITRNSAGSTTSPHKGNFSSDGKHSRNISVGSAKAGSSSTGAGPISAPGIARSLSASSSASGLGSENVAQEAQRRRKRDRILQRVSGRRQAADQTDHDNDGHQSISTRVPAKGLGPRGEADAEMANHVQDGERQTGGGDGVNDMDEDDPNAGQYVNYQIGFEYKRDSDAEKKGRGLHCLAYFGWGVKGIGKSEIPVYIDVISIKGTVNVRLLLSATPPFVRTGTFSFPSLPEYDVSAQPLKKGAFNAMEVPGMKQYVKQSIMEVASAFVRPNSYTLDLDRLLLGRESSLRTVHIGVLHIFINRAENLPKVDTMGSCDPYVSISLSKYHKPVFSTRTIRDTRDPIWDEEAFVLVASDAIEAGEKLRLRASDSDRFSADDALGVVEVDLADLVDTHSDKMYHRCDPLTADRPGMRSSGSLSWSVQFHPLWQMSQEETQAKVLQAREQRNSDCEPPDNRIPWWVEWIDKMVEGKDEKWVQERHEKRKETMAWFTGEKERDELEAGMKPSEDIRSGILQFHIHQCIDLEVEPNNGTYSSHTSSSRSAAGGKPALASLIDRTATENPDPPSAYTEVHLNDKLVYRTRTKQVTPLPYFNAVSERFVKDWTKGKIVFVVRDERNREHDPILGMVVIPLREAFNTRSQFTRWFPLVGGLGWGRIRISLLWKPVDMPLSHGLSGYEASTLRLRSFSFTSLGSGLGTDKSISVLLHTDSDKYELSAADADEPDSANPISHSTSGGPRSATGSSSSPMKTMVGASPSKASLLTDGTSAAVAADEELEMEFDLSPRHVRLAMMYRHSCSLVITFITRSSVLKKKKVLGVGVVRLSKMDDGEGQVKVGVYGTTDVERVLRAEERSDEVEKRDSENGTANSRLKDLDDDTHGNGGVPPPSPSPGIMSADRKRSFRRRISERQSWPIQAKESGTGINSPHARSTSISARSSRSSLSLRSSRTRHRVYDASDDETLDSIPLLGYANLRFNIIPGIGKVHRKIAKRDLRFAKTYEAWEACKEVSMGLGWDKMDQSERVKNEIQGIKQTIGHGHDDSDNDDDDVDDDDIDDHDDGASSSTSSDSDNEDQGGNNTKKRGENGKSKAKDNEAKQEILFGDIVDSEDEFEKKISERRAHSHALHKRHKGVFQLKIARTGRFVKDKIGAKLYSAANNGNGNKADGRYRGSDLAVEKEGISRM
ncbi:hypothetical protein IAU59_007510 [Kwoniella sp. CBS 9459]